MKVPALVQEEIRQVNQQRMQSMRVSQIYWPDHKLYLLGCSEVKNARFSLQAKSSEPSLLKVCSINSISCFFRLWGIILLSTHNFSTLHATLPHNLIQINLLFFLKEPSIETALLTLHVSTETHFFFREKPKKNIMHGLVKIYVLRWLFCWTKFYSIWHQVV